MDQDKISNELLKHNFKMTLDEVMQQLFEAWKDAGVTREQGDLMLRLLAAKMKETGRWPTVEEGQIILNHVKQSELT